MQSVLYVRFLARAPSAESSKRDYTGLERQSASFCLKDFAVMSLYTGNAIMRNNNYIFSAYLPVREDENKLAMGNNERQTGIE